MESRIREGYLVLVVKGMAVRESFRIIVFRMFLGVEKPYRYDEGRL